MNSADSAPSAPSASPIPSRGGEPWGPLAVVRGLSGGDFARNEGALRISDGCVVLERPGGETWLLIWGSEQTAWDAATGEIAFDETNPGRRAVRVSAGQAVELSGSGAFFAERAPGPEAVRWDEWVERYEWVAPPNRSCAPTAYWSVGSIAPLDR